VIGTRYLVVTADDFGIGPATTEGILDLASAGLVTGSVLLVNSPYAEKGLRQWRAHCRSLELGWHPCLTLDRPIGPAKTIPSLIGPDGRFWPLGVFIRRLILGKIRPDEIEIELRAQYALFRQMLGQPPTVVNFHHHLQVFPTIGAILRRILAGQRPLPYVRRVQEPWQTAMHIGGARLKRIFLSRLGQREANRQTGGGFPGNEWLVGITDPPYVADPNFLIRWLGRVPGTIVELTCHPGHRDLTLVSRDCTALDGQVQRRVYELRLLQDPSFKDAYQKAGFRLIAPSQAARISGHAPAHAA
jgi:chitin disaccharide deacetylase